MKKMLIDVSSVLKTGLYSGKDKEHGVAVETDKGEVWVNGWRYGFENAFSYITAMMDAHHLAPQDVILVVEGHNSKVRRLAISSAYKATRTEKPKEFNDEYVQARGALVDMLSAAGAQTVTQPGVEADDIIAYLAKVLPGPTLILSNDGDMAQLIGDGVFLVKGGKLVDDNPYGPFPCEHITVYKALVGDSSDNIKGAPGFGDKAFLDFLVWAGDSGLAALEGMIVRRTLVDLVEDLEDFKPIAKIYNNQEGVYQSYALAKMYPEWINRPETPLLLAPTKGLLFSNDPRLPEPNIDNVYAAHKALHELLTSDLELTRKRSMRQKVVFDTELIGKKNPVFLFRCENVVTGEKKGFWWHKEGDMARLRVELERQDITWVSFNGINFDAPIISAALCGVKPVDLKKIATAIIEQNVKPWELEDLFGFQMVSFDHVDLCEVAPGVRISLKTYAGRMSYKSMVDMPFEHDTDLTEDQYADVDSYCQNDLGVTAELLRNLAVEVELREEMSREYGIDLRSKSDAQAAEAILRKVLSIKKDPDREIPKFVTYKAPDFVKTDSDVISRLISQLHSTEFKINYANGQVEAPAFLDEPIQLGFGTYQFGVGGLHSTHDRRLYVEASEQRLLSDFDVASYYPNIMLKAGLVPSFGGDLAKGAAFVEEYRKIYQRRIEAKRAGDKKIANSLKITLNGTFGKLGSPYSAIYAPDLMLAVTLTGQLNLACLIHELEKITGVVVLSANTDGIMVSYGKSKRQDVLNAVMENAKRTGFEYEETPYSKVAMKDVNNYIAITADAPAAIISAEFGITESVAKGGKAKRKGLYAETSLMKNPTAQVCSDMAVEYLKSGIHPKDSIKGFTDIRGYVSIRNVTGGGVQPTEIVMVDDWVEVCSGEWMRQEWLDRKIKKATVKRKSRPKPVEVGRGGKPFGRIARWYMTKLDMPPIAYASNGNKVPKTEGARVCMTLPDSLPDDLDYDWYINEAVSILGDIGVQM